MRRPERHGPRAATRRFARRCSRPVRRGRRRGRCRGSRSTPRCRARRAGCDRVRAAGGGRLRRREPRTDVRSSCRGDRRSTTSVTPITSLQRCYQRPRRQLDTTYRRTLVTLMPPRYDVPKVAPEPLRLVQRFVNTSDAEHGREWLPDAATLERWLEEAGLGTVSARDSDLVRAHELRSALRSLLAANNGSAIEADAVETVNR